MSMCNVKLESLVDMCRHLHGFHHYSKKTFLCRFCHSSSMTREEWSSHYSQCQRYVMIFTLWGQNYQKLLCQQAN